MTDDRLVQQYKKLVSTYIEKGDERSLYEVSGFARACLAQDLGPEILVEMHSSILSELVEGGGTEVRELVARANQVLLEGMMTYGLVYQELLERKSGEYKALEAYAKKIEKQAEQLKKLYHELEISNQGTIVLYKELDEKNRELEQANTEVAATNKELEAFAYSVSHDLRAPLRSIDGFSHALMEDYPDKLDEQGKDYLRRVRKATQRMGMLIDDILSLSRVTRSEMRRDTVDLSALVQSIAEELQETQPERQVDFVIAPGLTTSGDSQLLNQLMENLLGNAWKFTEQHPKARIEFGVTQIDGKETFFIRDDGVGFDMTYADKLFGVFQRLHSQEEFPGTGVGLATVQRIAHRHGGQAWAEGEVEKGATFYFTLE